MQTFLPFSKFMVSAGCLDYKRLGKQRVEAKQILEINLSKMEYPTKKLAWENHPAVKMWRGYELALASYGIVMCQEWICRGYEDNLLGRFGDLARDAIRLNPSLGGRFHAAPRNYPPWLGNKELHSSHRAALLFKNLEWYSQFGWTEKPKIEYYWPVK